MNRVSPAPAPSPAPAATLKNLSQSTATFSTHTNVDLLAHELQQQLAKVLMRSESAQPADKGAPANSTEVSFDGARISLLRKQNKPRSLRRYNSSEAVIGPSLTAYGRGTNDARDSTALLQPARRSITKKISAESVESHETAASSYYVVDDQDRTETGESITEVPKVGVDTDKVVFDVDSVVAAIIESEHTIKLERGKLRFQDGQLEATYQRFKSIHLIEQLKNNVIAFYTCLFVACALIILQDLWPWGARYPSPLPVILSLRLVSALLLVSIFALSTFLRKRSKHDKLNPLLAVLWVALAATHTATHGVGISVARASALNCHNATVLEWMPRDDAGPSLNDWIDRSGWTDYVYQLWVQSPFNELQYAQDGNGLEDLSTSSTLPFDDVVILQNWTGKPAATLCFMIIARDAKAKEVIFLFTSMMYCVGMALTLSRMLTNQLYVIGTSVLFWAANAAMLLYENFALDTCAVKVQGLHVEAFRQYGPLLTLTFLLAVAMITFTMGSVAEERNRRREYFLLHKVAYERVMAAVQRAVEVEKEMERKSSFFANVSHEIRTPLHGILGLADILIKTPLGSLQLEYMDGIKASAEGMLQIVNDVMDITKIDACRFTLQYKDFDLRKAVEKTCLSLHSNASRKGLDLLTDLPVTGPLWLNGDEGRFMQVCNNLLSNAIKFSKSGSIVVKLKVKSEDKSLQRKISREGAADVSWKAQNETQGLKGNKIIGGNETGKTSKQHLPTIADNLASQSTFDLVRPTSNGVTGVEPKRYRIFLTVADQGIGIQKKDLKNLFDRFYQVGSTSSSEIKGTGLGLDITRQLCRLMEGSVSVKSEYCKGSTFTASFMFPEPHTACPKSVSARNDAVDRIRTNCQGRDVVVVSDNYKLIDILLNRATELRQGFCAYHSSDLHRRTANNDDEARSLSLSPLQRLISSPAMAKASCFIVDLFQSARVMETVDEDEEYGGSKATEDPSIDKEIIDAFSSLSSLGSSLCPTIVLAEPTTLSSSWHIQKPAHVHVLEKPFRTSAFLDLLARLIEPDLADGKLRLLLKQMGKQRKTESYFSDLGASIVSRTNLDNSDSIDMSGLDSVQVLIADDVSEHIMNDQQPMLRLLYQDQLNHTILKKMLSTAGVPLTHVQCVDNGADALSFALSNADQLDLCFIDLNMPVLNGIECAQRIRDSGCTAKLVCISASHETSATVNKVFDSVVQKPFPYHRIAEVLRMLPSIEKSKPTERCSPTILVRKTDEDSNRSERTQHPTPTTIQGNRPFPTVISIDDRSMLNGRVVLGRGPATDGRPSNISSNADMALSDTSCIESGIESHRGGQRSKRVSFKLPPGLSSPIATGAKMRHNSTELASVLSDLSLDYFPSDREEQQRQKPPPSLLQMKYISSSHLHRGSDSEGAIAENTFQTGDVHCLVVEDNPMSQHIARRILRTLNVSCMVAPNGLVALRILEASLRGGGDVDKEITVPKDEKRISNVKDKFNVILMDCQMPEMDGFQCTEEIRRRDWTYRNIPIIATTAGADEETCLESGMTDYIKKPYRALMIADKIRSHLFKSHSTASLLGDGQ